MIISENYVLSNTIKTPKLDFGTWMINNDRAVEKVRDALRVGYRHIDAAQAYGNEQGVGEGIRTSGILRDKIFVTTKLAAGIKNHKDAVAAIDTSLANLGVDYVDLMTVYSPQPWDQFR